MPRIAANWLCCVYEFRYASYCHYSQCRRFSGAVGNAIGGIEAEKFHITSGEEKISRYQKSKSGVLCFCSVCGSSLFGERIGGEFIHVRYGILNGDPTTKPRAHIHVASKAGWYEICDDLPQFSEFSS